MKFACGNGHVITAELTWATDSPLDLNGHLCPVCMGQVVDYGNTIDSRILAPMQPQLRETQNPTA